MLEMVRDLVAHKGHANAAVLCAIGRSPAAVADLDLRMLLDHVLIANRFWLLAILDRPFVADAESTEARRFDGLVDAFRTTHQEESTWLESSSESALTRLLEHPLIPGGRCSVGQALMQVCMHSHGHRAQCAKILRRHGGQPPVTDFIAWLETRPAPEWPNVFRGS